jgi:hypothetical protein
MPDTDIIFTGEPFFVPGAEPDHGAALRADEIVGGDADGPAQPGSHADDLVGGVDRARPPDLFDSHHVLDTREQLHADHGGLQPQQIVEIGDHAGEVERRCLLLHGSTPGSARRLRVFTPIVSVAMICF